jgi:hypothetical protein
MGSDQLSMAILARGGVDIGIRQAVDQVALVPAALSSLIHEQIQLPVNNFVESARVSRASEQIRNSSRIF